MLASALLEQSLPSDAGYIGVSLTFACFLGHSLGHSRPATAVLIRHIAFSGLCLQPLSILA
jgi:hypothetical protein